eukprot:251811_1
MQNSRQMNNKSSLKISTAFKYYSRFYLYSICLSLVVRLITYTACVISKTNRIQYTEIIDNWWCPSLFREFLTRTLFEMGWKQQEFGKAVGIEINKIIENNKNYVILNLCSGCSGPSDIINKIINTNRNTNHIYHKITTILTDLYPEKDSWNEICDTNSNITYNHKSTDATNIKLKQFDLHVHQSDKMETIFKNKQVIRTLTSSFHHFSPELGTKIFYDGFINNDIVIICDVWTDKSLKRFLFKFVFVVLMAGHTSVFHVIRFWLFQSKSNIVRRIIKCIILIKLWPLFLFAWNHDSSISEARFYSIDQIKTMAKNAVEKANKQYTIRDVPIYNPKGIRSMTLFICTPMEN